MVQYGSHINGVRKTRQARRLLSINRSFYIVTHDGDDIAMKHEDSGSDDREYQCLLRATNGKTINFSTRVRPPLYTQFYPQTNVKSAAEQIDPSHLSKFYAAYGSLLKTSLSTLRKRDKRKEKTRSEQTAKRKKRMTEAVVVNGPKRGAGRRKRQRQLKAAIKQQESQKKFKEKEETRRRLEQSV